MMAHGKGTLGTSVTRVVGVHEIGQPRTPRPCPWITAGPGGWIYGRGSRRRLRRAERRRRARRWSQLSGTAPTNPSASGSAEPAAPAERSGVPLSIAAASASLEPPDDDAG